MKKILFSALIALALFALPVQAQVTTSKINSQSVNLSEGYLTVDVDYDLDSASTTTLVTEPFSLTRTSKLGSIYNFEPDTTNPATWKLSLSQDSTKFDIRLIGVYTSITDTMPVDTMRINGSIIADSSNFGGLLHFNKSYSATKYFITIKNGNTTNSRDVDNGKLQLVFRKPRVLR